MPEHVHGCLNCRPDMVPDFDRADPRYHGYPKCHSENWGEVLLDGSPIGYTQGIFEGVEGWVLYAGYPAENVHSCPCGSMTCLEPRFGHVEMRHGCPSGLVAQIERLKATLEPLVSETVFWRAVFGRDVF